MIVVLSMIAALWGIGWAMKAPMRARWGMSLVILAGAILLNLVLPEGHALRRATGGDARLWVLLVGFGLIVWVYRRGLRALRARARPAPVVEPVVGTKPTGTFSEGELARYARHMILRDIGGPGQKKLKNARVLVVGAGGLGSPALLYLAASGVGTIAVIDDDVVEESNLQRQIIHSEARVGAAKVDSAASAMAGLNHFVKVEALKRRLTAEDAAELIAGYDVVLDGSDNFTTRYLVNAACVQTGKPLISAAMTTWEGQIGVFAPHLGGPCYQCVFPEAPAPGLVPTCAEAGVVAPLPGIIGSMMAAETVKLITGAGEPLVGRLAIHDALYADSRVMHAKRRADCPICGTSA